MEREHTDSSDPNRRVQIAGFFRNLKVQNIAAQEQKCQKWNFNFFTGMPLIQNQNEEKGSVSPPLSPVRSQGSHGDEQELKDVNTPEFERHQSRQDTIPVPESLKINLFFEEAKSI